MSLTNLSPTHQLQGMRLSGVRPPPGIQQEDHDLGDADPVDGKWKNDGPLTTGGPWDEACPGICGGI